MEDKIIDIRLQNKYDQEENWTTKNPVLLVGEIAISSDKNGQFKVGNGFSTWSQLSYNQIPWTSVTGRPSALKNPTALNLKLNGVAQEYDGSVERTINITASSIGAATSSHTHNYLSLSGGTLSGNFTLSNSSPVFTVKNVTGNDSTIILDRNTNASWKISNSSGKLYFMNNWVNGGKGDYFNALTLDYQSGNAAFKGAVTAPSFSGNASTATIASKLGTVSVGNTTKPFYLNDGVPTAFSANIGSTSVPVYMDEGAITTCTSLSLNTTGSAAKWTTARNLVIGNKTLSIDGSKNVSATLAEIGAATSGHTHGNYASKLTIGGVAYNVSGNNIDVTRANLLSAIGAASELNAGTMSAFDKSKLDSITVSDIGTVGADSIKGAGVVGVVVNDGIATISHGNSGVTAGSYGADNTNYYRIPNFTVNANGHVTVAGYYDITAANLVTRIGSTAVTNAINATTATTSTKLGSATVGSATRPIYLSAGVPTLCTYTMGSVSSRDVKSATSLTSLGFGTNNNYIPDISFLSYWNGKFNDTNSNLAYCNRGAFGNIVTKTYTDSSSASAIGAGVNIPTERDIYYGLPTINGAHNYTSSTNIYAPTTVGTSGYILTSNGSGAPVWKEALSVGAGIIKVQDTEPTTSLINGMVWIGQ